MFWIPWIYIIIQVDGRYDLYFSRYACAIIVYNVTLKNSYIAVSHLICVTRVYYICYCFRPFLILMKGSHVCLDEWSDRRRACWSFLAIDDLGSPLILYNRNTCMIER